MHLSEALLISQGDTPAAVLRTQERLIVEQRQP
jgi:hypothetical protein